METGLIRIKADMEEVLDTGHGVLLVLLDPSAALGTLDHAILRERLGEELGFGTLHYYNSGSSLT